MITKEKEISYEHLKDTNLITKEIFKYGNEERVREYQYDNERLIFIILENKIKQEIIYDELNRIKQIKYGDLYTKYKEYK